MKSTVSETSLTVRDFQRYFKAKRLGRLYFPNGKCIEPNGEWFENAEFPNFFIHLDDLFKMICGWKINHTVVPLEDILAIIAFGSAVSYPGTQEISHTCRKYLFFGEMIKTVEQVPIQPNDVDFLVITGQNLLRDEVLEPISLETYDAGTWIKKGGIHIVNRGANQVIKGVLKKDSVSLSALNEGVPIFFNKQLSKIVEQTGIAFTKLRKILWEEDCRGYLIGRIQ